MTLSDFVIPANAGIQSFFSTLRRKEERKARRLPRGGRFAPSLHFFAPSREKSFLPLRGGGRSMIGLVIAVIIGILLIGLLLKIIKVAIILALCVGIVMFAQNKLGRKQIK